MIQGFLGTKIGMTHLFTEEGKMVPVTVVQAGPVYVTQIKTAEKDGYTAVQVGFGEKSDKAPELSQVWPPLKGRGQQEPCDAQGVSG